MSAIRKRQQQNRRDDWEEVRCGGQPSPAIGRFGEDPSRSSKREKSCYSIDTAEQSRLESREAERFDDQRVLVRRAVGHLLAPGVQEEYPSLRISQCLDELCFFEVLLLDTGVVALDPDDGMCALFHREEVCGQWAVRQPEPNSSAEQHGQATCNYLRWNKVSRTLDALIRSHCHSPMNHLHGAKLPVSIQSTP